MLKLQTDMELSQNIPSSSAIGVKFSARVLPILRDAKENVGEARRAAFSSVSVRPRRLEKRLAQSRKRE